METALMCPVVAVLDVSSTAFPRIDGRWRSLQRAVHGLLRISVISSVLAGYYFEDVCFCQPKTGPFVYRKEGHLGQLA